jgi:ferric-dicitrate binding protein FerR (iron transport regulator)
MESNFTNYTPLDFAQEPTFIRWIKRKDDEAGRFWQQWLLDHPDQQNAIAEARRMVNSIQLLEQEPSALQLDKLWGKINDAIESDTATPVVELQPARRRVLRAWMGYAAAACIAALCFFMLYNPATQVKVKNGEQISHLLPDGSKISINAGSSIAYKSGTWGKRRKVELDGEAFFEVKKGETFTVVTELGEVEVLGTSFNVRARGGSFAVGCVTGKVKVSNAKGSLILTPGLATYAQGENELKAPFLAETQQMGAWRQGKFDFKDAKLGEIFAEIQRQFDVQIATTGEVAERKVSRYFEAGNLDSALYKVCWPSNLEIKKQGKMIVIR